MFFRNSLCLGCKSPLGYEPGLGKLCSLLPAEAFGSWRIWNAGRIAPQVYMRCANLDSVSQCNWLLPQQDSIANKPVMCQSCRLERTIPDLSMASNAACYSRISFAKRRLIALLIDLGLPIASKEEEPEDGLAFDFLRSPEGGPQILTGHDKGIITLNIEEAEDATRERIRSEMGESYRTLLGHLRHEIGHYYWTRLVNESPFVEDFRKLFGDERLDYSSALANYYQFGAKGEWPYFFVSAYASSHPWEDWAETWAHYLHIIDTLNTARGFGLDPEVAIKMEIDPFQKNSLYRPSDVNAPDFLDLINSWTLLTSVLNELSQAMGSPDFYPFVLCENVVAKLHFIHLLITQTASRSSANSSSSV